MSDPFFGELYLRTTRPFLSDTRTAEEAAFLRNALPRGPLLDLGCGHGRHARHVPQAIGLDFDPLSLMEARTHSPVVRADFRALPFRDHAFEGAWAWYNSLGTLEDHEVRKVLRELARCLKPGAGFIVQGTNIATARAQPTAGFDAAFPDGSHLIESAAFDSLSRRDVIQRRLSLPNGRALQASFFIRYYELDEWHTLLAEAGLHIRWWVGGVDGSAFGESSSDLIFGAERQAD
jgi:SAM-dependent methyltransferase